LQKNLADRRASGRANSSGFTLIEVVVALAIAALGLGALMAAAGSGLENARLADQFIEATRRAQSRLVQVGATMPLEPGEQSGDDGGGFSWRLRISPVAFHAATPQSGQQPLTLYNVEVTIGWLSGRTTRTVSLQSQRVTQPRQSDG
jgi:general secretion pathway protein I